MHSSYGLSTSLGGLRMPASPAKLGSCNIDCLQLLAASLTPTRAPPIPGDHLLAASCLLFSKSLLSLWLLATSGQASGTFSCSPASMASKAIW